MSVQSSKFKVQSSGGPGAVPSEPSNRQTVKPSNHTAAFAAARQCLGEDGLLSVVMPAYRLAGTIADNIRRVRDLLTGQIPFEIVVVDDGSGDGTAAAIQSVADESPDLIRPLILDANAGKGNAVRRGFYFSKGTHILLLDADLDLLPEMIPGFFDVMLRDDADIVIGSKRHPDSQIDYPFMRRLASRVYYGLVKLLVGLPTTDTQTGMKLFKREALQWSFDRMLVKRFAFDLEMLSIAYEHGFKVSEAPIKMHFGDKMGALNFAAVRSVMTDTLAIFYRLRLIRYYQHVELSELSSPPPRVSVIIACPGPSTYLDEALDGLSRQTLPPYEIIVLPDKAPTETRQEGMQNAECRMQNDVPTSTPPGGPTSRASAQPRAEARNLAATAAQPPCLEPSNRQTVKPSNQPAGPTRIPIRVVPTGRVRPAEKRNLGIEAATGDIIAFLDDDASPQPQWLAQACRHFSRDKVGAVGGPAITPPRDPFLARLGGEVYESPLVSGTARFRYVSERLRKVDDIPSCNLLVRANVLREVGGFNTRYWPGEDTILCLDIVRRGHEMVYDPFAIVFHHRRPLFGPHLRQIGRYAHHRGFFCRVFPQTSLRFSYMVPSLFVLGAVLGPVACHFLPVLWPLYIGVMGFYLAITFIFAFKPRPHEWLILWLGIMSTHVWYGVRFIQGLLFGRMPKEVRAFDHGGGHTSAVAEGTQIIDNR